MNQITLTRPDDWHLHVRDNQMLQTVLPHTARQFGRAIIMPNLKPPVTTTHAAQLYRNQIIQALPEDSQFNPLMTLYLTDNTSPEEISRAKQSGIIYGVKYYPAGATTNSAEGITGIKNVYDTLAAMSEQNLPLLVHGEVVGEKYDIFDREKIFIDQVLQPICDRFKNLRIVFEHITTREAVEFVTTSGSNIGATITPQHLLFNRNAILAGGIRPHYYCLPVLKRNTHQEALILAATNGNPKFFLGTDSAPHTQANKETACGCAGIYSAHAAMECYATAFENAGKLDALEAFASFYGADFYGLPRNKDTITLKQESWTVPDYYPVAGDDSQRLIPLYAGERLNWKIV